MTTIVHSLTGITTIENVIRIEETDSFISITNQINDLENSFAFVKTNVLLLTISPSIE